MYIRQPCLFSFDEIMKLQPETRLEKIFSTLDLSLIINSIEDSRWGPHGYSLGAKLRAILAMIIENIPTFTALVERLRQDPVFRFACGFPVAGQTPSVSTFSRLFKVISDSDILQQYFQELVEQLRELKIIDNEYAAIDATKLESKERAKSKKNIVQDGSCPDWGSKKDSHGNQITWFGWKVHLTVDCNSELPVAVELTPASRPDGLEALPLVKKTTDPLEEKDYPKYWAMDSGYDYKNIYEILYHEYNSQAIIPLNLRNEKIPPEGLDFDGTPVCSGGYRMVYWGSDKKGCNKFRCPHVLGKVDCPHGSAWCSSSNYGLVVKTRVKEDPRRFTTPHRGSKNWKKIYNKRTAVERCFGRLKEHLNMRNLNVRGIKKAKARVLLSCIAMLSIALLSAHSFNNLEQAA